VDGRDDLGGLDIDAALVEHIGTFCAERDPAIWQRLTEPATLEDRRAQRQLWDDVRIAKERLSRLQSADVVVPLLDLELHVTREELEELARPVLDQTVQVTRDLLRWADLAEGRLAGVFLVGGASRIPLVATLLHRELGEAPVVIEQPELVVAEGSILADAALLTTQPAAPGPTAELRLVSQGWDDGATVRGARLVPPPAHIPGTTGLQPAVDPWPNADHGNWVPDPQATVATAKPRFEAAPPVRPKSPAPPRRDTRPMPPVKATSRPVSPSPQATPLPRTHPRTLVAPPAKVAKSRPRRRRGRFLRFVQIMLSIVVMVTVPLAALLAAYGYGNGNGDSLEVDAHNLVRDIVNLLGIRY